MKKIAKFMFVAAVAAFALVSCEDKNPVPNKEDNKEENKEEPKEEAKLAVDGKFDEWANITPVEGQDAILFTKTQVDDKKLYFYIEADASLLETDNVPFANYLHLCLDCGGDGTEKLAYWGGEEGCTYDAMYQIWLMTNGTASMANWDAGFAGKAKLDNGIYKCEISIDRSANELFSNKIIYYGIYVTDQTVETEDGQEVWLGGDLSGMSPVQGEEMAKVK